MFDAGSDVVNALASGDVVLLAQVHLLLRQAVIYQLKYYIKTWCVWSTRGK